MKVQQEPPAPLRWCLTLSGRRIHATVPVRTHSLTLCREVVYKCVSAKEVRGRTVCMLCRDKGIE